jgi:hypothetical protein
MLLVLLFVPPGQAADSTAGYVKTVKGTASIIRQGKTVPAVAGARVFKEDTLRTGPDGSLGITFLDDTVMSLGASTEIALKDFEFSPAEGRLSMVIRMLRGTAVYLSGIIAKLAPKAVRFETPKANIGVRGTRFAVKVEGDSKEVRR